MQVYFIMFHFRGPFEQVICLGIKDEQQVLYAKLPFDRYSPDKDKMHFRYIYYLFIALVGRRVYDPPNGEWLPSLMDISKARGRVKPLLIAKSQIY